MAIVLSPPPLPSPSLETEAMVARLPLWRAGSQVEPPEHEPTVVWPPLEATPPRPIELSSCRGTKLRVVTVVVVKQNGSQ